MKLTREEFRKYIFSYNEDEAFYKKLYLQKKKDSETFQDYCLNLDRNFILEHHLYVPELLSGSWSPYMEEKDFFQDTVENIMLYKHYRYTPVFSHKHEFFEILCVYDGTADTTIQGIRHTRIRVISASSRRIPRTVSGSLMTARLLISWCAVRRFSLLSSSH